MSLLARNLWRTLHLLKLALSQAFSVCTDLIIPSSTKCSQGIILHHTRTLVCIGGAAESAGVCVGDCVVEVNGESCEDCEPAKIVALKFMIQQTNVRGVPIH